MCEYIYIYIYICYRAVPVQGRAHASLEAAPQLVEPTCARYVYVCVYIYRGHRFAEMMRGFVVSNPKWI